MLNHEYASARPGIDAGGDDARNQEGNAVGVMVVQNAGKKARERESE